MSNTLRHTVLVAALVAMPVAFLGCGGGSDMPFNPNAALFTTAPAQVTLDAGASASYQLNGGTPRYSATSSNPNAVKASTDGLALKLAAVTPGSALISVTDAAGSKLSFNVTVVPPGSAAPLAVTPTSLAVGNCTTRIPLLFSGGAAPYRVLTSDNVNVHVSSPLPLGDGRYYFLADVAYAPVPRRPESQFVIFPSTLTVLDSQGHSGATDVATTATDDPCSTNPLFSVSPESADFRSTNILAFQLSGGSATATPPTVTFADQGVAEVRSVSASTIEVQAVSAVQATTLMTVAHADGQRASVIIRVSPQP